jgi:hypothetical protein
MVENDGHDDDVSGACRKLISDSAFKRRCSDLFFHLSCLNELALQLWAYFNIFHRLIIAKQMSFSRDDLKEYVQP